MQPLAIDLYCGLGGWAKGLLEIGFQVIGFDTERHEYGDHRYPAQLVIQDVRTLHGSQFRGAGLIVASPPCQRYSYMAMPWTRAKDLQRYYEEENHPERRRELNELFDACFRIQGYDELGHLASELEEYRDKLYEIEAALRKCEAMREQMDILISRVSSVLEE